METRFLFLTCPALNRVRSIQLVYVIIKGPMISQYLHYYYPSITLIQRFNVPGQVPTRRFPQQNPSLSIFNSYFVPPNIEILILQLGSNPHPPKAEKDSQRRSRPKHLHPECSPSELIIIIVALDSNWKPRTE